MSGTTMIVLIVIVGCATGVIQDFLKHRGRLLDHRAAANEATEERLKRIEQRLANLETIMLDRNRTREFDEALR